MLMRRAEDEMRMGKAVQAHVYRIWVTKESLKYWTGIPPKISRFHRKSLLRCCIEDLLPTVWDALGFSLTWYRVRACRTESSRRRGLRRFEQAVIALLHIVQHL